MPLGEMVAIADQAILAGTVVAVQNRTFDQTLFRSRQILSCAPLRRPMPGPYRRLSNRLSRGLTERSAEAPTSRAAVCRHMAYQDAFYWEQAFKALSPGLERLPFPGPPGQRPSRSSQRLQKRPVTGSLEPPRHPPASSGQAKQDRLPDHSAASRGSSSASLPPRTAPVPPRRPPPEPPSDREPWPGRPMQATYAAARPAARI